MNHYDPRRGPKSATWLALDEQERMALVEAYHRRSRVRLPNAMAHAIIHVIVENQIAMAELTVRQVLQRLRTEGLSRHDAVHAIGNVLAIRMNEALAKSRSGTASSDTGDLNEQYLADLEKLTAKSWLHQTL